MPEAAGSCSALHRIKARHDHHQGEAFPPFAQLRSQSWTRFHNGLLVSTTADQKGTSVVVLESKRPAADVALMTGNDDRVSGYFDLASTNCGTILE